MGNHEWEETLEESLARQRREYVETRRRLKHEVLLAQNAGLFTVDELRQLIKMPGVSRFSVNAYSEMNETFLDKLFDKTSIVTQYVRQRITVFEMTMPLSASINEEPAPPKRGATITVELEPGESRMVILFDGEIRRIKRT